jgi:hypothetical protein
MLKYKYATFEQINSVVKPILAAHDLFLNFTTNCGNDGLSVTAVITHKDGYSRQTTGRFPVDDSGGKTQIQALASGISYGKRHMMNALLNITTHGEDDDGFASQKMVDGRQIEQLNKGLIFGKVDPKDLCDYMEVENIGKILDVDYTKTIQYLQDRSEANKDDNA